MSKRSKQRKITNAIKLRSICIDLTSKLSKTLSYNAKHSKQRKSTKRIKLQWIASIWCQNDLKCWVTSQNIQNNAKLQNWSSYMYCIDLTSKRSKIQNIQHNTKQQKWSNYNELHRFDVKKIKRTQNYEITSQNIQNNAKQRKWSYYNYCIDMTSKRSKPLS